MKNKMLSLPVSEIEEIKKDLICDSGSIIVEVEGSKCLCLAEYLRVVSKALMFPRKTTGLDVYNDWICG